MRKLWLWLVTIAVLIGVLTLTINFINQTTFDHIITNTKEEYGEFSQLLIYDHSSEMYATEEFARLEESEEINSFLNLATEMELTAINQKRGEELYSFVVFFEETQSRLIFYINKDTMSLGGQNYELRQEDNDLIKAIKSLDLAWERIELN
ncbi:hypothetical protein [Geomicrobium sediminis]|uniref:DUF4825 domain-containing protein n=1 Tax=Geomicrobium sediminis TaxID=1347788 RepID=A0ABS2P8W2_9BACL|nr:hypothetical protein [Geomicrobium sediminis]MBM7631739.1 hypothetical protein [Geomicrobium sediminis]